MNYAPVKAGTLQSFGFIITELTMLLSLLYCLDTLQYTKLYLPLILTTLAPVFATLALFYHGTVYTIAIVLTILTAVANIVYTIILLVTFSSYSDEMQIANQTFGFYVLIGLLLVQTTLIIWSAVLLFQLRATKPVKRLAAESDELESQQWRTSLMIGLLYAYLAIVVLSSLLNLVPALHWTAFYIVLFLPYGVPYLMCMTFFKVGDSITVGAFLQSCVALIDLIYTVWLLLSYRVRSEEMQLQSFGIAGFWLLIVSFLLRVGISLTFVVLSVQMKGSSFYQRFDRTLNDKTK
jgi:hypothetical protein